MTIGRSSLKKEDQLTDEKLEYVSQLLMHNVTSIEKDLLIRSRFDQDKLFDDLIWRYQNALTLFIDSLHMISRKVFRNINIKDVKTYTNENEIPKEYRAYLRVLQNMKDFICYEILNKEEIGLSLIATERWIFILKIVFEANDFFLMTAICSALHSISIDKSSLINELSKVGKGIHIYFGRLTTNQVSVYQRQILRFERGEDVVPMLSTLSLMLDRIQQQPDLIKASTPEVIDKFISQKRRKMSNDFVDMQERIKLTQDNRVFDMIFILSHTPLIKPEENFLKRAYFIRSMLEKKSTLSLNKLFQQIKLYQGHDDYYWLTSKLYDFTHELNELANYFKTKTNTGSDKMQKCLDIKNVLQNDTDEKTKLINIYHLLEDTGYRSNKKIKNILNEIADVLNGLISFAVMKQFRTNSSSRSYFFEKLGEQGLITQEPEKTIDEKRPLQ